MKAAVLATLIALLVPPVHQTHNGESEDDARARYGVIAEAVADEALDDKRLALFLLTVARHESSFVRKVHSGKVRGDKGKSWSLFQFNVGRSPRSKVPGTSYRAHEIVGVDTASTSRAVDAAATWLRPMIKRCNGRPRCVFIRYGGISKSAAKSPRVRRMLDARVATYRRLSAKRK